MAQKLVIVKRLREKSPIFLRDNKASESHEGAQKLPPARTRDTGDNFRARSRGSLAKEKYGISSLSKTCPYVNNKLSDKPVRELLDFESKTIETCEKKLRCDKL